MSDNTASHHHEPDDPRTIADLLAGLEPIRDLNAFVIHDLTPDEEDEFFRILQDA